MATETKLLIVTAQENGYFTFGNKGACWNNQIHIGKGEGFLCGHNALSGNHFAYGEKTFGGKVPTEVCVDCATIYYKTHGK